MPTRRFEDDVCNPIVTKLIYTPPLTANRNEIGAAESSMKMNRMIELLSTGRVEAVLSLTLSGD